MLKRISKPGTIKKFRKFSEIAQKFPQLFVGDNYIIGFPEALDRSGKTLPAENFGQIMDSFKFSLEMNLDWSAFSIYQQNSSPNSNKKEWADVYEDFIPTKDVDKGKLIIEEVQKGYDIFTLNPELAPSRNQLKEIWPVFNLARNFVMNKNLAHSGNPKKFIDWTSAVQERYPTHADISFFLSLAHLINGDTVKAKEQYSLTKRNLEDPYWSDRFKQFSLNEIADDFPQSSNRAIEAINYLKTELTKKYA